MTLRYFISGTEGLSRPVCKPSKRFINGTNSSTYSSFTHWGEKNRQSGATIKFKSPATYVPLGSRRRHLRMPLSTSILHETSNCLESTVQLVKIGFEFSSFWLSVTSVIQIQTTAGITYITRWPRTEESRYGRDGPPSTDQHRQALLNFENRTVRLFLVFYSYSRFLAKSLTT